MSLLKVQTSIFIFKCKSLFLQHNLLTSWPGKILLNKVEKSLPDSAPRNSKLLAFFTPYNETNLEAKILQAGMD